ncbi:acyl-CoA N-acyltransferase [Collybia nuda]|uniref:Acyl-CoA N-acyltransferase n=1 Tax=Collybia nuda TaxID=64659 RepID=A0A9P5YEP3_9AGAR|nr:acyl-CoA N-acyltransferase [Collybia nuda]
MFTTSRLQLRAYCSTDLDNLILLYNDPLVAIHITEDFVVPRNVNNFGKILEMVENSLMFCMVEERVGGAFVGWSAILPMSDAKNRNAAFGLAFLPHFWHKGYGMEVGTFLVDYAFRCLAMHRVSLSVFEGNDRAIALYKRLGFVEEGRLRKSVWIDGGWKDNIMMAILEDEWVVRSVHREREES